MNKHVAPSTDFNSGATPQQIFKNSFQQTENLWPHFCHNQQGSGEMVPWHTIDKKQKVKDLRKARCEQVKTKRLSAANARLMEQQTSQESS